MNLTLSGNALSRAKLSTAFFLLISSLSYVLFARRESSFLESIGFSLDVRPEEEEEEEDDLQLEYCSRGSLCSRRSRATVKSHLAPSSPLPGRRQRRRRRRGRPRPVEEIEGKQGKEESAALEASSPEGEAEAEDANDAAGIKGELREGGRM